MPEKSVSEIPRPLREQYEKGLAAIQRQNLDYAISILEAVLKQEPGFYPCREALRAAQFKRTGVKPGFFKRILGKAASSPLLARGQIALRTNPVDAIPIAEQILNGDPNSSAAHKMLADGALAADLPRTAVLSLEIVFKNAPARDVALKLGQALARAGQADRAQKILGDLSATFPNDPEIARVLKDVTAKRTLTEGGYEGLEGGGGSYRDILKDKAQSVTLEQEGRSVKAEDIAARLLGEYESQIANDPGNLKLLRSAAELHAQIKQFDKALEYYRRITAAEGVSDPTLDRAITETTLRKLDDSLSQLDTSASDYADQAARLKAERDRIELEAARERAERYPNDLQIRFELGEVYFRLGRYNEAIGELQKAQNNPHRRIQSMSYLAQCFSRRGMNDLAARTLENAIREKTVFDETRKELVYLFGCVLETMGKTDEAIEQFKQVYELDIGYKDVAARVDAYYASQKG